MPESNHLNAGAGNIKKNIEVDRVGAMDKTEVVSNVPPITNLRLIPRRKLVGHLTKIYSCVWSPIRRRLLSSSLDGKLIVWDTITKNKIHAISNTCEWILTCAFSKNNENFIACGGLDNAITIYKLNNSQQYSQLYKLIQHDGYISNCTFTEDNNILSCSGDQTCILWDVLNQKVIRTFKGHSKDVTYASIAPDGKTFLTASVDNTVRMWDFRSDSAVQSFKGHETDVNAVEFFPNGLAFGTVSEDHTAALFDIRSGQKVAKYSDGDNKTFTCLAFSNSGRVMFLGADDSKCYCMDVLNQNLICVLGGGHHDSIKSVGVSPQGDALFTASSDSTIRIWN